MRTGKKDQALITGRIAYGHDGTNAYAILVDTSGRPILGAGTNVIGKVRPVTTAGQDITDDTLDAIKNIQKNNIAITFHPFGKGLLTTTGVQYSTALTTAASTAYVAVETATITIPGLGTPDEVEFGLTGATAAAGTTDAPKWKWQASDDNTSWQDLIAEQTGTAATTMADGTISGRFAPVTNFLCDTTPIYLRMVIKAGGATNKAWGKTKNSSYLTVVYRA